MTSTSRRNRSAPSIGSHLWERAACGIRADACEYPAFSAMDDHAHPEPHFSLVLNGDLEEEMGRHKSALSAGTVVFRPTGTAHSVQFGPKPVRILRIRFNDEWIRSREFPGSSQLKIFIGHSPERRKLMLRLTRELECADPYSPIAAEAVLLDLLIGSQREEKREFHPREQPWLRSIRERLREDFNENYSLADLAREAGVHPAHLARAFRRSHGCTIGDYLRTLRVQFASERLSESDSPLAAIAVEAGFADQSHFNRCFKDQIGLTPLQYRSLTRS